MLSVHYVFTLHTVLSLEHFMLNTERFEFIFAPLTIKTVQSIELDVLHKGEVERSITHDSRYTTVILPVFQTISVLAEA